MALALHSQLCAGFAHSVYTVKDILTTIPFYRQENQGLKRQTVRARE